MRQVRSYPNHRRLLGLAGLIAAVTITPLAIAQAQTGTSDAITVRSMTQIMGRPTDRSIALSVLSPASVDAYVEFGTAKGRYTAKTAVQRLAAATPAVFTLTPLTGNKRYHYRLRTRTTGTRAYAAGTPGTFVTQRAKGTTFTFSLQGDSHPERANKMYDAGLYQRTMDRVAAEQPDFYVTLGDDFSLDRFIDRKTLSRTNVEQVYADQRAFLSTVGSSSALFLVNGNHEQAARTHLDGTPDNPAVLAGNARNKFFALPAPDAFYTGDTEEVPFVGLPRDYYSWTWGDALFVVIDPYWHSPVPVDVATGDDDRRSGNRQRDWWGMSIGDAQYNWLKTTLEQSTAKYKFVFSHHVMGTGRGGVEMAGLYEWGGRSPNGADEFAARRPTWELPIHQLMVKNGVTIFFQGHDHLYAHQELDGLTYQETPNPADSTYQAFNREAYESGTILPNAGHLRVTVGPQQVRVEYVRSFLPKDETATDRDGVVADSYVVNPRN